MTQRQRENLAKYLYDLSKVLFATAVVGNLIAGARFDVISFLCGGIVGTSFLGWGYFLDGNKPE